MTLLCMADRTTHGGGLLVYVKSHLNCSCRADLKDQYIEYLWLEIRFKNSKPLLICYAYRPPSLKVEWITSFLDHIDKSYSDCKETIV